MKVGRKRISLKDRFWSAVDMRNSDECWPWIGPLSQDGYGKISAGGRYGPTLRAHRVAWALTRWPIPSGLQVLHHCDNPRCVNPKHLFLGTHADNMADMVMKGRQAKGGSPKLTEEDVCMIRNSQYSRSQLACLYGISPRQVSRIKLRVQWVWLRCAGDRNV